MASRYVPPHLRKKLQQNAQNDSPTTANDAASTEEMLARRRLSDLKLAESRGRPLHTIGELNHHYGSTLVHSTLRDSSSRPGQLGYVVLFKGANPRWKSDHILFAHTNINILPGYAEFKQQLGAGNTGSNQGTLTEEDATTSAETNLAKDDSASASTSQPQDNETPDTIPISGINSDNQVKAELIPVFMQTFGPKESRNLLFHGFFRLIRVDFLKPQSPELVRMLNQKWGISSRHSNTLPPDKTKQRPPEAWAQSLKQEWAVVQFESVPQDECPDEPKVEVLPEREQTEA